jgi:hypothetical protein
MFGVILRERSYRSLAGSGRRVDRGKAGRWFGIANEASGSGSVVVSVASRYSVPPDSRA